MRVMNESAQRWIEAAKMVRAGVREGLRCPENDDGDLVVTWLPAGDGRSEFRLRCASCGAENYMLVRDHVE
jgi:hypothetical protein